MARPPIAGREREQALLHEELTRALAGQGRLVLLGGEAGIGKTTLVVDLAETAIARGARVLVGQSLDLSVRPPYGPWMNLATVAVDQEPLPLPPALRDGMFEGLTSQAALHAEILAGFTALTERAPLVLILEDLHWADQASLELLRFLAVRIRVLPVLIVATYRVDELTRRDPLFRQIPALASSGETVRFELRPLSIGEQVELLRGVCTLEPSDEARLAAYLATHAEGNPFFVTELLRALQEEGQLESTPAGWRLGELDRVVVPAMVQQVIEARLARLSAESRHALMLASVVGQEVPIDLWRELGPFDESAIVAAIEEATDAHLLESDDLGERVRFVHALTREAAYAAIVPRRRRGLHRQVVDRLMARPRVDPDVVASHLVKAGDPRAPDWLEAAGNRAMRAYDWIAASQRFAAAADALAGEEGTERRRGWLLYRAARLLRMSTPREGQHLLRAASQLAEVAGDELLAAEATYSQSILAMYDGDFAGGITAMIAGIEAIERLPEPTARGDASITLALADTLRVRETEAEADLELALAHHRETGMHHRWGSISWWASDAGRFALALTGERADNGDLVQTALAHAHHGLGIAQGEFGRLAEARASFERALHLYRTLNHQAVIATALLHQLHTLTLPYEALELSERRQVADAAVTALQFAGGAIDPRLPAATGELALWVLEGRWTEARALLAECPSTENTYLDAELVRASATLAFHSGDDQELGRILSRVFPPGGDPRAARAPLHLRRFLARLGAEQSLLRGDRAAAERWAATHELLLGDEGGMLDRPFAPLVRARLAAAAGDVATARACLRESVALARNPVQPVALLTALRELGELLANGRDRAEPDTALAEALDLANRARAPVEIARTLLARARSAAARAERQGALADLVEVEAILQPLGAGRWLAAAHELRARIAADAGDAPVPFGLTPREREVLRLVALGLTDAEVGEQLFISSRTASQHLRSIFAKLEVSTRAAATRIAIESGLA